MCGIAGIIKWTRDKPAPWAPPNLDLTAPSEMSAALAHRGPDGEGIWTDPRPLHIAALVHRRLAIIDLPGGTQPMANEDGSVHVVFNGEIYNHAELRRELLAAGHRFHSDHSDTEVLVHGWEHWGEQLPSKVIGMFAFAIWDTRTDTLFLARDRMGQKPLFYATLEDGLVFGSTIPSILAWPEVPRRVPQQQLSLYLLLGFLPPPHTIYRDISQIMPGHFLRLQRDVLDGGAYWSSPCSDRVPGQDKHSLSPAEIQRELATRMRSAVTSQLIADTPITCFLSGGLDSSIIATLMQDAVHEAGGPPIHTVSVGFAEAGFDESRFAALVAQRIGSLHQSLQVNVHHNVIADLQWLMRHSLGEPFGDSSMLPTYHLSKAVRQIAPVALSGDGGDELFGGYDRYRAMFILQRWSWLLRRMPRRLSKRERWHRMRHASQGFDLAERYTRLLAIFSPEDIARLLPGAEVSCAPDRASLGQASYVSPARYAMGRDQREYLPGDVLWKVDSAAMACALEVRSPFLDHRVVEFVNGLPLQHFIQGRAGKRLLRQTFAHRLPAEILTRRKQGFAVPIGQWFRNELRSVLQDLLLSRDSLCASHLDRHSVEQLLAEHQSGQRDHTHRLFSLLMLELWWSKAHATIEK